MRAMRFGWLLLGLLPLAVGCRHVVLVPGEVPALTSREGLLATIIQNDLPISGLVLQPASPVGQAIALDGEAAGSHLIVMRAPAGRYCVEDLEVSGVTYIMDRRVCFEIRAGHTNYPGHMIVEATPLRHDIGDVGDGWRRLIELKDVREEFLERLRGKHPKLLETYPLDTPEGAPE